VEDRLTTVEVASKIKMSEEWVRDHAGELGGFRAGRGPRAPLRFPPDGIRAYEARQRLAPPEEEKRQRRPGRRAAPSGVDLLPLPQ
jgi:hypothetical protein